MPVIKEKTVIVSSVIENLLPTGLPDGEPEKTEISVGGYFKTDGTEYSITYSEECDGERAVSDIVICEGSVRVRKEGAVVCEMIFKDGFVHKFIYGVPPYSFDAEITTKKIRNGMTDDGGRIDIFYSMKIGGAEKRVKMRIECV